MDKPDDRDRNPELTEFKDSADTGEPKVAEAPAKSNSGMPKFQIDPAVLDEVPGTHFPAMQSKKKRSSAPIWIVLALLVLGVGGYFGYTYWQQQNDKLAQKDQQIASLTQQKTQLEADAQKADSNSASPAAPAPADTKAADKAAITDVVSAQYHAVTKDKDLKIVVNVMKQNDQFAYVNAGPQNAAAQGFILKKVDSVWTIVYKGQEKVTQADIDKYSIPTEFQSGQ